MSKKINWKSKEERNQYFREYHKHHPKRKPTQPKPIIKKKKSLLKLITCEDCGKKFVALNGSFCYDCSKLRHEKWKKK